MSSVIAGVDQRTQLVGQNRLELLLFKLTGKQTYGINVFKVREVICCPALTQIPHSSPVVRGVANMRGRTITIIDLGLAIGGSPVADIETGFVIVTEFNRRIQGFLVARVEHIVNMNWEAMHPPPNGTGKNCYMTAVTDVEGELVAIIDVENVLAELVGVSAEVSSSLLDSAAPPEGKNRHALVVDDSLVARKQIIRTIEQLGITCEIATNGREAIDLLAAILKRGERPADVFDVVISDIEMPEMDGYTLTKHIKSDPLTRELRVLLHTSLSGVFNTSMVERVGADKFISKFDADELGKAVLSFFPSSEPGAPAVV